MFLDERPDPAPEPDTTFEPVTSPDNEAEQTATRRAVSLASHAGVGVAGAAGVVAVQQVTGTGDQTPETAGTLDVFQDAGAETVEPEPRGLSSNAEPVIPQPTPPTDTGLEFGGNDPQPAPLEAAMPSPAVEFIPNPEQSEATAPPLPEFSPSPQTGGQEPAGEELEVAEPERGSFLASAETEIGGGFAPDDGHPDADGIFGASSEIGGMELAGEMDDEDDDGLASSP